MVLRKTTIWVVMMFWTTLAFPQGLFESAPEDPDGPLSGGGVTVGGFIRSAGYLGNTPESNVAYLQSAYGQAGLLLEGRTGSGITARADLRFRAGTEFRENFQEWMIREAYVDYSGNRAGIRFGKMIVPWGKGSVFHPSDKITPLDPTVRSPEEDDMKLGFWGMQGHLNLGSYLSLSATWKPVFQPSVLLIDPVPMPGYVRFTDPWTPEPTLSESSWGIDLQLHHPLLDAGIYWFQGYHHWPGIALDTFILDLEEMGPEELVLREHPYRIKMAGIDVSLPLGSWIIRGETAWQRSDEQGTGLEYIPLDEWSWVAEMERSAGPLELIAGYYGKYISDYKEPAASPSLAADETMGRELMQQLAGQDLVSVFQSVQDGVRERIASFNRLYNYQLEKQYHSAYMVLRGSFLYDVVECTIPVVYNFTVEEWTFQPQVTWRPADGLAVTAGYSGLFGPEDSLYDLVGPALNAGFLSMKLTF